MELNGELPAYDHWYTTGRSIGRTTCAAPTAGRDWRPVAHPVVTDLFGATPAPEGGPFTTVMNWRSHDRLEYRGVSYGQKDVEFERFAPIAQRHRCPAGAGRRRHRPERAPARDRLAPARRP
jgi:hypothetical protein